MQGLSIPYLQVRSNTLYQYNQSDMAGNFCRTIQSALAKNIAWQYDAEGTIIKHNYTGVVTAGAKKRLTKAIENLVQATPVKKVPNFKTGELVPFKLSFLTLTITDNVKITGKEAHKTLLAPFLQWLRRAHNVQAYIWKAELQKRGTLHYHITSDAHIHWEIVRSKWNELQRGAGYLDRYYKKKGHYNANSTDIRRVEKITNMAGYLIKEVAKSFQNEKSIGGKVWDCSQNLKAAKYYTTLADSIYEAKINMAIRKGVIVQVPCKSDHCRIFRMNIDRPASCILNETDIREYREYMEAIRTKELVTIKEFKPTRKKLVTDFNPETWYQHNIVPTVELITKKAIQLTFNRGEADIGFRVETALHCSN